MNREAWRAVVHGVTKNWTWLNWTMRIEPKTKSFLEKTIKSEKNGITRSFLNFDLLLVGFLSYHASDCFWFLNSIYKWPFGLEEQTGVPPLQLLLGWPWLILWVSRPMFSAKSWNSQRLVGLIDGKSHACLLPASATCSLGRKSPCSSTVTSGES